MSGGLSAWHWRLFATQTLSRCRCLCLSPLATLNSRTDTCGLILIPYQDLRVSTVTRRLAATGGLTTTNSHIIRQSAPWCSTRLEKNRTIYPTQSTTEFQPIASSKADACYGSKQLRHHRSSKSVAFCVCLVALTWGWFPTKSPGFANR